MSFPRVSESVDKLVVGCGYLGSRVAKRWCDDGFYVAGMVRHIEHGDVLALQGVLPIVADVTQPQTLEYLPEAETILCSVGYNSQNGASRRQVYVDGLQNLLDRLGNDVKRIVLISSTGVYGSTNGGEVDEDSPCEPTRSSGEELLEAERLLLSHPLGDRAVILRLAGIYGPGRMPRIANLAADIGGAQVYPMPANHFINLIHVDDAMMAVIRAETAATPRRIYNISDGHPLQRREYMSRVAKLAGLPEPKFCEPSEVQPFADSSATERRNDSKRVSNRRMLAELGVTLQYPEFGIPPHNQA